jgi:hypothetical protein
MRTRGFRGAAAGALAPFLLLICTPGALAGPQAGERYDGKSATGQRIFLSVSSNGARLARYSFSVRTTCTDGKRRVQSLLHTGQAPTSIDAAGAFAHESQVQRGFYSTRSGRVDGRFKTTVSGTFDAAGDSVSGTIESTFRSSRFDCSSDPVSYTIYRDGTPQAPLSDAVMSTGLYNARGKGVAAKVDALAPGRTVLRAELNYRARCSSGGNLRSGRIFSNYLLSESGRRIIAGRARFRIRKDNVTVRIRFRLGFRFFQSAGYKVAGSWSVRAKVFRRGQRIDACRMNKPFKGTLAGPPA